jgi:hypothetical protein
VSKVTTLWFQVDRATSSEMSRYLIYFSFFFTPLFSYGENVVYPLQGVHSKFGTYVGQLEIRTREDGLVDVNRIISYDTFRFENKRVEQVWHTVGKFENGILDIAFVLKRADIYQSVDNEKRTPDQFNNSLIPHYHLDFATGTALVTTDAGVEQDKISGPPRPSELPLWKNERIAHPSEGESYGIGADIANNTAFLPVILELRYSPFIRQYWNRAEYKSQLQYFVIDKTDYDFLRLHPDFLRIDNKIVDTISLYESLQRSNAYGPTLLEKENIFDRTMPDHLNENGFVSQAIYDSAGNIVTYHPSYDGALWTGMYAGTQAMRWLVTKDERALALFKQTLCGMMLLMDVTGNPQEFARTIAPYVDGEVLKEPWVRAQKPYEHLRYVKIGNNDMVHGLYYSFAWAYEILPDGDPLLVQVEEHSKRLLDLRISTSRILGNNAFRALGLNALATRNKEDINNYFKFFYLRVRPKDWLKIDQGMYFNGIADWSGINLSTISQLTNILIAKNLIRRAPQYASNFESVLSISRQNILETWATYATARRDIVTFAAEAFGAADSPYLNFPKSTQPKTWSKQELWPEMRKEALWTLREIPLRSKPRETTFDFSLKRDWCASPWPNLPWKYFKFEGDLERFYQGSYAYPLFETNAIDSDNSLSRPPFMFRGKSNKYVSYGRMDYLHAYWLGRLSGLIGLDD